MVDAAEDFGALDSLFEAPPLDEQERMVEAILFASAEPISVVDLSARMPHGSDAAKALEMLKARYEGRGVNVRKSGDGWAIRTSPDLGFLMTKETVETRRLRSRRDRDVDDHCLSPTRDPVGDRGNSRRERQPGYA